MLAGFWGNRELMREAKEHGGSLVHGPHRFGLRHRFGTASRTVTITGISGDGFLSISIVPGIASDIAGNTSAGVGPSQNIVVGSGPSVPVNPWLLVAIMAVLGVVLVGVRKRRLTGWRGGTSR